MCKRKTARRLRKIERLAEQQKGRCFYCGCRLTVRKGPPNAVLPANFATIDHIRLKSEGGGNDVGNCVAACFECNNGRNNADAAAFAIARVMWRHLAPYVEARRNA